METPVRTPSAIWPLAGTAEFAASDELWRATLSDRLEGSLRRHVVDAWYPRTVDRQRGGFKTDFDRHWRPTGPDERMLEYQARHTRSVARLGQAYPDEPIWREYALHGLEYMVNVMRDSDYGGWFWMVDQDGSPIAVETKHAHSTAYVIAAFIEVYRLTGNHVALDNAQRAFDWLDATLHDNEHGGYHGWATRDGKVIRDRLDVPGWSRDTDPLGHDIGLKDLNIHSDLLDSLRLMSETLPSPRVAQRADELIDIVAQRFVARNGRTTYLLEADLTRVDGAENPGYNFQSAYRLPLLARAIERPLSETMGLAKLLVDHGLEVGWVHDGGGVRETVAQNGRALRQWWVQTETFLALVLLELTVGGYRSRVDEMVALFEREMIDAEYGGWLQVPVSEWSLVDRLRVTRWPKAHRWKDPSHETDLALMSIRMLRGLTIEAPLS